LVGVVTMRDLTLHLSETQVGNFMNRNIIKLKVHDSVKEAAKIFKKYKFLAIPVVDEKNQMKGIITLSDGVEAIHPEFGE
jgi:magnesium transporter